MKRNVMHSRHSKWVIAWMSFGYSLLVASRNMDDGWFTPTISRERRLLSVSIAKRKSLDRKRAYLGEVDRHAGLLHNSEASSVFY